MILMTCCNSRYATVVDSMNHLCNATNVPAVGILTDIIAIQNAELYREDRQLHHLETGSVDLTDRPKNASERRQHAISRVLYTWLRRETDDVSAMMEDIASLAALGRTERWKTAVRTWVHVAQTEPDMFFQYATYTNYAA